MSIALHHVAIIVSDIEQAALIYGDILGLELDNRPDLQFKGLFYKLGNGQQLHLMQLENPDQNSSKPEHGGRYRHFALSVSDLENIEAKLKQADIAFTSSKSGRKALFFYDVDGNVVELVQQLEAINNRDKAIQN